MWNEAPYALDRMSDQADYAVIGPTDGRTRVMDTARPPYGAVCHLERDFGDGRLTGCTAFFVSPTRLLTAGHCVMSHLRRSLGLPHLARRIRITPGRAALQVAPFGQQWAASWRVHPQYARRPSALCDVAVIDLARPFSRDPGHFAIASPTADELVNLRGRRMVHISGYPGDKPKGQQWEHSERIDRVTAQQLFYSVDTCPGHSGAPVWLEPIDSGPRRVIAVHTAGPRRHAEGAWGCAPGAPVAPAGSFNRGVRLTSALSTAVAGGFRGLSR